MPRKKTSTPTESAVVASALPALKPNQRVSPEQFTDVSRDYGPREGLCWYLYRIWPVIDRRIGPNGPDAKSYIEKLTELPDGELSDWLTKKWGSGDYSLCLTDAGKPRGHTQVCRTSVKIRDESFAPVLDLSEIVEGDPANKAYIEGLRARGLWLVGEESDMSSNNAAVIELAEISKEALKNRNNAIPSQALEVMADASRRAVEMAAGGGASSLSLLKELLPMVRQQENGGSNELVRFMMEQHQQNQKFMADVITRLHTPAAPAAPPSPLNDSLKQVLEMDTLLGRLGRRGGGAAAEAPSWTSYLPQIIAGVQTLAASVIAAARAPQPYYQQAVPVSALPPAGGQGLAGADLPTAPSNPVAAPGAATGSSSSSVSGPSGADIARQIANALTHGFSGDVFAAHVVLVHGETAYDQVRAVGTPALVGLLQSDPEAAAVLAPFGPETLATFIEEFMEWGNDEADEDALKAAA